MNLKGEPAYVGRHCGSNTYSVTPELVAFYGEALDDRSPLYGELAPSLLFHSEWWSNGGATSAYSGWWSSRASA